MHSLVRNPDSAWNYSVTPCNPFHTEILGTHTFKMLRGGDELLYLLLGSSVCIKTHKRRMARFRTKECKGDAWCTSTTVRLVWRIYLLLLQNFEILAMASCMADGLLCLSAYHDFSAFPCCSRVKVATLLGKFPSTRWNLLMT